MPPFLFPLKINNITSPTNALMKQVRGLHQRSAREKSGLFLIEGPRAVAEAYAKRVRVVDVVVSQTYLDEHSSIEQDTNFKVVSVIDDKLFREISTTATPAGILAIGAVPKYSIADCFAGDHAPLVVIAHGIQDPGNLGTIFRTALASWATGVILTKGTVDAFNPKVVRSAMGALFAMPMISDMSLEAAVTLVKGEGLNVIACEPTATQAYFEVDLAKPTAIILANEGQGFTDAELAGLDNTVAIPMNQDSESLNVAVSAAIVLFEAVKQRINAGVLR